MASRCVVSLCDFGPRSVECSRPGCTPDATRCARHLIQRGCDTCFALLCDAHAIVCADCAVADEGLPANFFVEGICGDCFARSDHTRCSKCDRVVCESHFDSMFGCDECDDAHCHDCATFGYCRDCDLAYCGKGCPKCGGIYDP